MNGLTDIEKRFASSMVVAPEVFPGFDIGNPEHWPYIREQMRKTAYHEAGHFAARRFTKLELSHVLAISIIGNEKYIGYVRSERPYEERSFEFYPPPLQRSTGRMLLLEMLAGMGAELILDQSEDWESIFEYWELNDGNDGDGTDFSRALHIADIIARPYMPVYRVFWWADKWTLEMLRIPAVWDAVETVAGRLLEQGVITDKNGELSKMAYDSAFPSIFNSSKWRRRLLTKPGELDEYFVRE